MNWHYTCPQCRRPVAVDWSALEAQTQCMVCGNVHYPPTPQEDRYAWLEADESTPEMKEAALILRGTVCMVPGCYGEHETLVYRVPLSKEGKNSVDNLMPVCGRHAATRGERDWDEWLAEARLQEQKDCPTFDITFTKHDEPEPVAGAFIAPTGFVQPIYALGEAAAGALIPKDCGGEPRLLFAVPFLRGPAAKIEFDYDWQTTASGTSHLYLLVWPRGEKPEIALLGGAKFTGLFGIKEHLGVAGDHGNNRIELFLPPAPAGRWTAGVALIEEGCKFKLGEFVLAAST